MMDVMEMKVRMDHGRETWNLEGSIRFLRWSWKACGECPAGQTPIPEGWSSVVT